MQRRFTAPGPVLALCPISSSQPGVDRTRSSAPKLAVSSRRAEHLGVRSRLARCAPPEASRALASVLPARHALAPEVLFGCEGIVGRAAKEDVGSDWGTTPRKRLLVVQFEISRLATALAASIDIRAAPGIAFAHHAALSHPLISCGDSGFCRTNPIKRTLIQFFVPPLHPAAPRDQSDLKTRPHPAPPVLVFRSPWRS
jgi:hypothetical protein